MSDQIDHADRISVLLVDDERSLLEPLSAYLSQYFSVTPTESGNEAQSVVIAREIPFDVALVDGSLSPGPNGIELMKFIRGRHPNTEVIIFTGWGTDMRQEALRAGAFRYLEKPFDREELMLLIRSAAQLVRQRSISQQMLATHGQGNLLEMIIAAARSLVFADDAAVVLIDPVSGKSLINKSAKAKKAVACFHKHLNGESLTNYILTSGDTYSIPDVQMERNIDRCLKDSGYRAFLGLPIPGEKGNQGVLYVYSRTPHLFDELGNTALLHTIAAQAGLALTNTWADDQIDQHSKNMEALVHAGSEFSTCTNLLDLYNHAYSFVSERLGLKIFFIAEYNCEKDEVSFPIYIDEGRREEVEPRQLNHPNNWGMTGYVIKNNKEVFYRSHAEGEELARSFGTQIFITRQPAECCFFFPLVIDGRVAGVFSVQSQIINGMPALYIETLRALGNHLAAAIKNIWLHAEEQRQRKDSERKNSLLRAMTDAMNLLRSEKEPYKLLHETVRQAALLLGFKYGALFNFNAQVNEIELVVGHKLPVEFIGQRIAAADSLIGRAVATETLMEIDAQNLEQHSHEWLLSELNLVTVVTIPIKHPNQPETKRALLLADDTQQEHPQALHEVLEILAQSAAIIFRTSELIKDEKRRYEQLTILQKANEFIQSRRKVSDILHLILTGITAGYGLGFNRAMLLMVDRPRNGLIGQLAIGYVDTETAQDDWRISHQMHLDDFQNYLKALDEGRLPTTPLNEILRGHLFRSSNIELQKFLDVLAKKIYLRVSPQQLNHIAEFRQIIQPTSELGVVPLICAGEVIGVIVVDNKFTQAPITVADKGALIAFANTAAVAVGNDHLLSTLERTREAALRINHVSVLGDLQQTLVMIREGARQVLDCDMFTLYIFDKETKHFIGREHYGSLDERNIRLPKDIRHGSSPYKLINLQDVTYYYTEDSQHDIFFAGDFADKEQLEATLAIKLVYNKEPVGGLFINYRQPHHFTQDEIENALLFADQAAIAIQNAVLYERSRQHSIYLKALNEAGKAITASLSLEQTLKLLADQARTLTGSAEEDDRFCNVLIQEGENLCFKASSPDGLIAREINLKGDRLGITGRTFTTGISQRIDNVQADPDYVAFREDTASELCVPLIIGDRKIGVINVESRTPAAFKEQDQFNLESLAAQAAIAIQNAHAFDELRKAQYTLAARTNLLYWGIDSSVWRHSINNYALTISEQAGLFQSDLKKRILTSADRHKLFERLNMIQSLAQKIIGKPITPPLSSEEGVEPVLIGELVRERTSQLIERYRASGILQPIILDLDVQVMVWASPEWLRVALDILVDNAIKAVDGCPQQQVMVGIRLLLNQQEVEIFVRDTGSGIPPADQEILGEGYIPSRVGKQGMGLGLVMAKMIAHTYQGKLGIGFTGSQGTEMTISLPVYHQVTSKENIN